MILVFKFFEAWNLLVWSITTLPIWNFWNSSGWRVKRHVGTLLQSLIYATHSLYERLGFNPTPFCVHTLGVSKIWKGLNLYSLLVRTWYEAYVVLEEEFFFEWNTAHKTIIHSSKKFFLNKGITLDCRHQTIIHSPQKIIPSYWAFRW